MASRQPRKPAPAKESNSTPLADPAEQELRAAHTAKLAELDLAVAEADKPSKLNRIEAADQAATILKLVRRLGEIADYFDDERKKIDKPIQEAIKKRAVIFGLFTQLLVAREIVLRGHLIEYASRTKGAAVRADDGTIATFTETYEVDIADWTLVPDAYKAQSLNDDAIKGYLRGFKGREAPPIPGLTIKKAYRLAVKAG